jgi:hypothetical protein
MPVEDDQLSSRRSDAAEDRLTDTASHAEAEDMNRRIKIEPLHDFNLDDSSDDVFEVPRNIGSFVEAKMFPAHDLHGLGHELGETLKRRNRSMHARKHQETTASGNPWTKNLPRER